MPYIPDADPAFNDWVKIFAGYINVNYLALGLTLEQNNALQVFSLHGQRLMTHTLQSRQQ